MRKIEWVAYDRNKSEFVRGETARLLLKGEVEAELSVLRGDAGEEYARLLRENKYERIVTLTGLLEDLNNSEGGAK